MRTHKTLGKWIALILAFFLMSTNRHTTVEHKPQQPYNNTIKELSAKYNKDEKTITEYVNYSIAASNMYKIDPLIILAIIETESAFKPTAYSKAGAQGLMQVIPKYHTDLIEIGDPTYLYDPEVNIRVGTAVLIKYLKLYNGNLRLALNKYSGDKSGNYFNKVINHHKQLQEYES